MKKIINILILFISCSLIISCQKEDEGVTVTDVINIVDKNVTVGNEKGSVIIRFSASGIWSAIIENKASAWCTISKTSGQAGDNSIEITVDKNNAFDERNASLTIVCGNAKEIITITQKQKKCIID